MYDYYKAFLGYNNIPSFLEKYLLDPVLLRLKKVGYFCGMDYASKEIYTFGEYISRYDHSLNVALLTWKLTNNRMKTIAALYHDVATPCFSHVIDYMNNDYLYQESTEAKTGEILRKDVYLSKCLELDYIGVESIIDFKSYSIVDNNRPKLCADRLDGIIMTGTFWAHELNLDKLWLILNDICTYVNDDNEDEIGFQSREVAKLVYDISNKIDKLCHSKEDNYMMDLLSRITKRAIDINIITYDDLFKMTEDEVFDLLMDSKDEYILNSLFDFRYMTLDRIKEVELPYIKRRDINPIADGKRLL